MANSKAVSSLGALILLLGTLSYVKRPNSPLIVLLPIDLIVDFRLLTLWVRQFSCRALEGERQTAPRSTFSA